MEWWQQALISFGKKEIDESYVWNCLICQEVFASEDEIQAHLKRHNFEDFEALKFEVTLKGLKGENWSTLSENSIDISFDTASEDKIVYATEESFKKSKTEVLSLEPTPFSRRSSRVRKRLSLEDTEDVPNQSKKVKADDVEDYNKEDSDGNENKRSEVATSSPEDTLFIQPIGDISKTRNKMTGSAKKDQNIKLKSDRKSKRLKEQGVIYTCDTCNYSVESHLLFHKHIATHSEEETMKCWYCAKSILTKPEKKENEKTTLPLKVRSLVTKTRKKRRPDNQTDLAEVAALDYTCFLCSYSFESTEKLDKHLTCVHPEEIEDKSPEEYQLLLGVTKAGEEAKAISTIAFYCHICDWKSNRHFNFHRHVLSHTIGKSFKCTYCEKIISTNNSITGYGQISSKCEICDQTFQSKFKQSMHMYEVHGTKSKGNRECTICGYRAWSKKIIQRHHILFHGDVKFNQDDITVKKKQPPVVKRKDPSQYTCEECGFTTGRIDTMEKHKITHLPIDERELFACKLCEYQTFVKSSLNMHMSRKHKNDVVTCDWCSSFTTTDKSELEVHKLTCKNEPEEENKELSNVVFDAVMTPALGDVSGYVKLPASKQKKKEKKYQCDFCDLSFNRKWNMDRHSETAHDKQILRCEHCEYYTKNCKHLYKHYINIHYKEPPAQVKQLMDKQIKPKEDDDDKRKLKMLTIKKIDKPLPKVECQFCGMLIGPYALKTHLNCKHFAKKSFVCHVADCSFQSSTSLNLKIHQMKMHQIQGQDKHIVLESDQTEQLMKSMKQIFSEYENRLMEDDKGVCCGRNEGQTPLKSNASNVILKSLIYDNNKANGSNDIIVQITNAATTPVPVIKTERSKQIFSSSTPVQSEVSRERTMEIEASAIKPENKAREKNIIIKPVSYIEEVTKHITSDTVFTIQHLEENTEKNDASSYLEQQPLLEVSGDGDNSYVDEQLDSTVNSKESIYNSIQNGSDVVALALQQSVNDNLVNIESNEDSELYHINLKDGDNSNKLSDNRVNIIKTEYKQAVEIQSTNKTTHQTPQFLIEKKDEETTLITVQAGDMQTSYEICGELNMGPNGELPADLYNFISEMLNKQTIDGQNEEVVYCDIVVNDG